MKALRFLTLLLIFSISATVHGQQRSFWGQMVDSVRYYKANQKPKLLLGFDNRVTFLNSKSAKVNGLKIGVNYQKFSCFLGIYGTNQDIVERDLINQNQVVPDTLFRRTRFNYLSLGFTYANWASNHWYFETTPQIGLGSGQSETFENGILVKNSQAPIIPLEISGKAYYMFTKWIGLGAGLGVRKAVLSTSQFDGLFYSLGVKFYIGQFYRDVIKRKDK